MDRSLEFREAIARAAQLELQGEADAASQLLDRIRASISQDELQSVAAAELELELARLAFETRNASGYARAEALLEGVLARSAPAWHSVRIRCRHFLGLIALRRWSADTAKVHLEEARRLLQRHGDPTLEARLQDSLGQLHEFVGDPAAAISAYSCSMAIKSQLGDRIGLAITLTNLGRLHCKLEDWEPARAILSAATDLARSLGKDSRLLSAGTLHALCLAQLGQADAAIELIGEIADPADEERWPLHLAYAFKTKSEIESRYGAFDEALRSAEAGLRIMERHGDRTGAGHLKRVLGEAQEGRGNLESASKMLDDSRALLRAGCDSLEELAALESVARVARKLGRKSEALAATDRGIIMARRSGCLRRLARLELAHDAILATPGPVELRLRIEWARSDEVTTPAAAAGAAVDLRVLRELGRGSYGVVYLVEDQASRKEYALKQLSCGPEHEQTPALERFRREALSCSRIRHSCIVEFHHFDRDGEGNPYILMEYVSGGSLSRRRLSWREVLRVAKGLAGALSAVHSQGIVHRDLKPSNVLLRQDGSPVLTDFGVAHLPGSDRTLAGDFLGSLDYLPPEAFAGGRPTSAWDMYALGVTLYEALEGVRPFAPTRPFGSAEAAEARPEPRRIVTPGVPDTLASTLLALLSLAPGGRPGADQLLNQIDRVMPAAT